MQAEAPSIYSSTPRRAPPPSFFVAHLSPPAAPHVALCLSPAVRVPAFLPARASVWLEPAVKVLHGHTARVRRESGSPRRIGGLRAAGQYSLEWLHSPRRGASCPRACMEGRRQAPQRGQRHFARHAPGGPAQWWVSSGPRFCRRCRIMSRLFTQGRARQLTQTFQAGGQLLPTTSDAHFVQNSELLETSSARAARSGPASQIATGGTRTGGTSTLGRTFALRSTAYMQQHPAAFGISRRADGTSTPNAILFCPRSSPKTVPEAII